MVERETGERRRVHLGVPCEHVIEALGVHDPIQRRLGAGVRHNPHRPQYRERRDDLAEPREAVHMLARIPVPIGGNEHGGGDLTEAIEHALGAEVWRAARPGGPE